MPASVDLNADVGEGFPNDESLLRFVSSANIACGFHAGDAGSMRWLCEACAERGVAVGAQVSYRDRAGFGRRDVEIGYDDLLVDLAEQVAELGSAATAAGIAVRYLKPHGALYNRAVWDREQARAVVDAAGGLPVLGLPGSVLLEYAAESGVDAVREFFADRAYEPDGTLVHRSEPDAVISSVTAVAERVAGFVDAGLVMARDGTAMPMSAESICVHGDTEGAIDLARAISGVLGERGVSITCFA